MSYDARESHPPEFRHRAEEQLSKIIAKTVPSLASKHLKALVDELQVHQIELLLQNQELDRTRQEAEERRDRYRDLFESAPVAYFTLDKQGRIQEMNGAAEMLLGVDRKTVTADPFAVFVTEDDVPRFTLACRAMLKSPGHHECDLTLNVGGVTKTMRLDGCATTTDDGGPQLRFALIDQTSHKHDEDLHRESEARLQTELTDIRLLQSISAQLIQEENVDVLYERILDAAIDLMQSDMASMQMLDEGQGTLRLLGWRGFDMLFAQVFGTCRTDRPTSCSKAMRTGRRVIVPDVETCDFIVGTPALEDHRKTGIRAVQSTPLFSRSGRMVGMISTHWRTVHCPSERDLRLFDVLVRQAADLIDRKQVMDALRESEARFRGLNDELEQRVVERTQELMESQERLRALAAEFNLTEHRERTRLATELHDHLAQMLIYGRMKLAQVKQIPDLIPRCTELIKETDDVLTRSLHYTQTLIADLSPPELREFGLVAALRWLAAQMQKYELTVHIEAPASPEPSMAEDRAVLLFQSVRELLINITKHAQTDQATVTVRCHKGILRLEVQDQGCGFDLLYAATSMSADTTSSRFGLFSIRERMKALGGSFDMESVGGKGTTATLILPLVTHKD